SVKVDGGPRYILGTIGPELNGSIVREVRHVQMSVTSGISYATAVGVPSALAVTSAQAAITYRPSIGTSAKVQGGLFASRAGTSVARVYQLSGSAGHSLGGALAMMVDYATDLQRGRVDEDPLDGLPIRRNVVSVSLVI